jgi:hypothetical protein
VVGVATGGEDITNAMPGQHGGNLDDHLHGVGTKIFFPVRQPGGMFGVGDMHASMGDGEICGTGVEIAGEVTVCFDLLKGKQGAWPVSETEDAWIAHGTAIDYPDAMREACREAAYLLADEWGRSLEDAFILLALPLRHHSPRGGAEAGSYPRPVPPLDSRYRPRPPCLTASNMELNGSGGHSRNPASPVFSRIGHTADAQPARRLYAAFKQLIRYRLKRVSLYPGIAGTLVP